MQSLIMQNLKRIKSYYKLYSVLILAVCIASATTAQSRYQANWNSIDSRPVPAWFEDAKFGIFIHWGLFSVPAWAPTTGAVGDRYAEWYWYRQNPDFKPVAAFTEYHNKMFGASVKYQDFVKDFKAEFFNPNQWAEVIKQAGAKYVVLTSKHHEGFTLWPSAESWNWNSVDVGPHRDLCGELSKSVKAAGIHMGFYYSLYEWFNPLYKKDVNQYVDMHMMPQLKDLVTRYQPDIVWTDGEWEHPSETWKSTEFLAWLYNESPVKNTVVVNDRWGKETRSKHGGYFTTEYDLVHEGNAAGTKFERPWEECRGIGGSFGYNKNENLEEYESSQKLINTLVSKVARGGNLLLNIGPTADGRIPVVMQQRLADIGTWLGINGEAIYGTRKWDAAPVIKPETTVFYTKKGNDLYVIVTKWQNQPIVVNGLHKSATVSMLGFQGSVKAAAVSGKLTIMPPALTPATSPSNFAWVYKIKNAFKNN